MNTIWILARADEEGGLTLSWWAYQPTSQEIDAVLRESQVPLKVRELIVPSLATCALRASAAHEDYRDQHYTLRRVAMAAPLT